MSLRYEELDNNGDLISYLNIVRSAKANFISTKSKEVIKDLLINIIQTVKR